MLRDASRIRNGGNEVAAMACLLRACNRNCNLSESGHAPARLGTAFKCHGKWNEIKDLLHKMAKEVPPKDAEAASDQQATTSNMAASEGGACDR